MRGLPFILTTALALGSGCAAESFSAQEAKSVAVDGGEPTKRLINGTKAVVTAEGTSDPCAMLITDPSLKIYYEKWRAYFDQLVGKAIASFPPKSHDHDTGAEVCSIVMGDNVGTPTKSTMLIMTRDGQFAGHEINAEKPTISYRVALEIMHDPLDKGINSVPLSPIAEDTSSICQSLTTDEWKIWDPKMPDSFMPQLIQAEIAIPCDPTATAWTSAGGCWYDEATGEDGCGGGATDIDRGEATMLIKCVRKMIGDEAIKLCL